jgi:4-amino-4-deoxy-L-arabinose transferase-like glycosyltransferase
MVDSKNEEDIINKRTSGIKKKILIWLKDPYNKVFLAILALAIIIRIYFLSITINQAVWWDAADYLTSAKVLANGLNIGYHFNPRRTILLPILWAVLLKLGFGELSFRILEFLLSVLAIPGMYLLGKELFDRKVGLISSFLLAVFWMQIFYSNKLMTEVPTLTFLIFAVYFFWKGYNTKNNNAFLWFGAFLGLAFLARAGTLVMFAVFPIFLIVVERFRFLKNKYIWLGSFITVLLMGSFFLFIYFKEHLNPIAYFLALNTTTAQGGSARFSNIMGLGGILQASGFMLHYFGWILLLVFIFSVVLFLFNLALYFDLVLKRESFKNYFFVFLLAAVPFIFQSIFYDYIEDRYLMNAFPAFFMILSLGLMQISSWLKKYQKYLGAIVIVAFLLVGGYQQITYGNQIITSKISSYMEVKEAGIWIKQNSNPGDIIFSASVPQLTYYAERPTYNFVSPNINISNFEKEVSLLKPKYLVLSIYEPHADWAYAYPAQHNDTLVPVQGYQQNNQPVLVIYQFKNG